jgi:hypothetical protein
MATASQKITEIKFLVLILGALTPPPTILTPVVWIPLKYITIFYEFSLVKLEETTYKAAPTTDKDTASPIPIDAHMYGDVSPKNLKGGFIYVEIFFSFNFAYHPTLILSPLPVTT